MFAGVVTYYRQQSSWAPVAERPTVLPPERQKEHSKLGSPLPLRQGQPVSDREVLEFLHRALSDVQRTSAQTLAMVSESYDLIRITDSLSSPLYRSADSK